MTDGVPDDIYQYLDQFDEEEQDQVCEKEGRKGGKEGRREVCIVCYTM